MIAPTQPPVLEKREIGQSYRSFTSYRSGNQTHWNSAASKKVSAILKNAAPWRILTQDGTKEKHNIQSSLVQNVITYAMWYRPHGRRGIQLLPWTDGNSVFQNAILSAITDFPGDTGFPWACAPWWHGQRKLSQSASGSPSATRNCPSDSSRNSPLQGCRRQYSGQRHRWRC